MKHLKDNNETYLSHLKFAGSIGLALIIRGAIFGLHALVPLCNIPRRFNLEQTSKDLLDWNEHTKERK
jgi:hypothetical protein